MPIDEVLPDLIAALRRAPACVLQAPPGAGKTTRVPLALLDAGFTGGILLLEPRRVAARAAATQIAALRGEKPGGVVGYQVRFDAKTSAATRILVVTEGILTRRFRDDPLLEGTGVVLLDEFHERSIFTDLSLAFLRELLEVRDDLKVVVMSATLDAAAVAAYLGGAPVVTARGRPFPVAIEHVEQKDDRYLDVQVAAAVRRVLRAPDDDGGDVLCFLPGAPEIRRAQERLTEAGLDVDVVPLYGALPPDEQDRALRPGPRRRIVLATNVAETSLTLPGVTAVVDTGLVKIARHDPATGQDRLVLSKIAKDNAEQRAGRAGRVRPGRALRLWTKVEHEQMARSVEPEIRRVDLASPLLDVLAFHPGDPRAFRFFEAPPAASIERATSLLALLGAVDASTWSLTPRGRQLAALPLHPRVGAVLLEAARLDVVEEGALYAALLGERDLLLRGPGRAAAPTSDSDLAHRADLFRELEDARFSPALAQRLDVDPRAAREVKAARDDLLRAARALRTPRVEAAPGTRYARMLLAGFPDRVCRRRRPGEPDAVMVGGRGAKLAPESGVRDAPLFLALDVDGGPAGTSVVRVAAAIDEATLADVFPAHVRTVDAAVFDDARGAMIGARRRLFVDLVLAEKTGVAVDADAIAAGLADAFRARWAQAFSPDERTQRLIERARFAARVVPDEEWPDVSDDGLRALVDELARGRRTLDDVARADWADAILQRVPYRVRQRLDEVAPERVAVPTGNEIRVDYSGDAPVLAVRVQELFGLAQTPRVANGRVPLRLHLLSPGYKPVQVTEDLASFWTTTYAEVRKELRARYPKHSWPDDPWTARPTARAKPRRS